MLNDWHPVVHNVGMNDPQPIDPRRRIRELLSSPERDRTDAEWDELNELEIRTAPGNREVPDRSPEKRFNAPSQGHPRRQDRNQDRKNSNNPNSPRPDARPQEGKPQEARNQEPRGDGRPPRRQHRRPKRPAGENPGNSGSGNGGQGSSGSGSSGNGSSGSGPAA